MRGSITLITLRIRTRDDSKGLVISRVSESNASARDDVESVNVFLGDIEVDWDGEESTVGETERGNDTVKMSI